MRWKTSVHKIKTYDSCFYTFSLPNYKYQPGNIFFKINEKNPNIEIYANKGTGKENMTKIDISYKESQNMTSD